LPRITGRLDHRSGGYRDGSPNRPAIGDGRNCWVGVLAGSRRR
jgi:hypothetical protein